MYEITKNLSFQKGKEKRQGRRRKRVLIPVVQIRAKYVFERSFTAKHLTMFGLFGVHLSTRRAEKKEKKKKEKKKKRKKEKIKKERRKRKKEKKKKRRKRKKEEK